MKIIAVIIFCLAVWTSAVLAQETVPAPEGDSVTEKYGIIFPVLELGRCANLSECRDYCDDPVNKPACGAYAKQRGFYKESKVESEGLLNKAKLELGCVSYETCKSLCSFQANYDKCASFAKENNLTASRKANPSDSGVLSRAKENLGCGTLSECKTLCSQEENHDKCTSFAKSVNLGGGRTRTGPGGCASEQTCTVYCSDPNNFTECSKYGGGPSGPAESFKGPGGCATKAECRAYCEKNPDQCHSLKVQTQTSVQQDTKTTDGYVYPTKTQTTTSTPFLKQTDSTSTNTETKAIESTPTPTPEIKDETSTTTTQTVQGASTAHPAIRIINFLFFGL